MGVQLILFLIVAGLGLGGFVFGGISRQSYIFVLGCALLIGAGALLWGFNGLIVDTHPVLVADSGVITYSDVVVDMSNVGLQMLSLVFVVLGVVSMFVINLGEGTSVRRNTYHY